MDALPPSLPNTGLPQPVPAGQAGLAILLADLSNALAQVLAKLPANTPLTALVTQILPSPTPADPGQPKQPLGLLVQVSTPEGPAQIRLPPQISVTPGTKLDIVVNPTGPGPQQPQARLLAINDRPVTPAMTGTSQPASAPASAPVSTNAAPSAAPVQMAPKPPPSQGIPATVVTSSDPALPSGTTLTVRITGLTLPQQPEPNRETEPESSGAGEDSAATPPAQPPAPAATPTPGPAPGRVAMAAPTPTPGPVDMAPPTPAPDTARTETEPAPVPGAPQPAPSPMPVAPPTVTVPAPAVTQAPGPVPAAPAAAAVAASPGPQAWPPISAAPQSQALAAPTPTEISGQVLPNTDAGKPLVRTPIGLLALDTGPQTLPPDSEVTLQLVGKPTPPPVFAPTLPMPDDPPDQVLPKRLTQLVETAQASPGGDALADAVREKIPAPGPKLAAQLLSVMTNADQPQGLAKFLGDGLATMLSHAAPQALEALSRHWEAASTPVLGPGEGDWRSLMIPFMMGGEITNLRLTVRQRHGKMAAAEREKGTRFLLDLDLSRLGPVQFDGLVKRQHKRFDLIIRTKTALSGEMRRDIDALFINGLINFGLEGSVAFQPEGRFIVTPRLTGDAAGIIFA
jgi:hypothetical protein